MGKRLLAPDSRAGMVVLLFAFWAAFWGLNGLDKFFNGKSAPNTAVTSGVILDRDGNVAYRIHPTQPIGWFGVTRDPKFIAYFRTLHLSPQVALTVLYSTAVVQLALCAVFIGLLARALRPGPAVRGSALADQVLPRLAFKASIMVFYVFLLGDILFGDRMEVWEHGTYLILLFVSWETWHRAAREFPAVAVEDAPVRSAPARKATIAA